MDAIRRTTWGVATKKTKTDRATDPSALHAMESLRGTVPRLAKLFSWHPLRVTQLTATFGYEPLNPGSVHPLLMKIQAKLVFVLYNSMI